MPENNASGRNSYRNYDERPVRSAQGRPQGARPQGARPQGQRPSQGARPQGQRPQGQRPPQGGRRPAPRRRKKTAQPRFFLFIAIAVVLIVVVVIIVSKMGSSGNVSGPSATPTPVPQNQSALSNATVSSADPSQTGAVDAAGTEVQPEATSYSTLAQWLGDEESTIESLSVDQMVKVSDLSLNTSLPDTWMNVLLLGTDERMLNESARTDSMIICSINKSTGAVKLTSIMRDTAVDYDDLPQNNGTYRINAANYFGGPQYAMKTVNECFGMNIQNYVTINFYGFQKIASALGGIDINITQEEMEQINKLIVSQAKEAYAAGVDESDLEAAGENVKLETFGENTHLNGRQTLAYARIRKIDSDFSRAERQRTVLNALMNKLKGTSAVEILALVTNLLSDVSTNMNANDIGSIAVTVLSSGLGDVESFRLPVANSYKQETRNEQSMLYDCDWTTNALDLYNFIYE